MTVKYLSDVSQMSAKFQFNVCQMKANDCQPLAFKSSDVNYVFLVNRPAPSDVQQPCNWSGPLLHRLPSIILNQYVGQTYHYIIASTDRPENLELRK